MELTARGAGQYELRALRGADTLQGSRHVIRDDSIQLRLANPDPGTGVYVAYSPVTGEQPDGGNAVVLADPPVRAYHEPDIIWWIEHQSKT